MSDCIDHGRQSNVGYARSGSAYAKGEEALLHRRVFLEVHGYLPPVVMHVCDNPRCINPDHLAPGDWDTNNKDRAKKGRSAKVRYDLRKLTFDQAQEIRARYEKRIQPRDPVNGVAAIARDYGVDSNVIYNIVEGRSHLVP